MTLHIIVLIIVFCIFFGTVKMRLKNPLVFFSQKEMDRALSDNEDEIPEHTYRDRVSAAWHIIRGKGFLLRIKK